MGIQLIIATTAEPHIQEMSITLPEVVLLIAGGLFTIALLTLFIFVLRKDIKRDKNNRPEGDLTGDDPSEDESGG